MDWKPSSGSPADYTSHNNGTNSVCFLSCWQNLLDNLELQWLTTGPSKARPFPLLSLLSPPLTTFIFPSALWALQHVPFAISLPTIDTSAPQLPTVIWTLDPCPDCGSQGTQGIPAKQLHIRAKENLKVSSTNIGKKLQLSYWAGDLNLSHLSKRNSDKKRKWGNNKSQWWYRYRPVSFVLLCLRNSWLKFQNKRWNRWSLFVSICMFMCACMYVYVIFFYLWIVLPN